MLRLFCLLVLTAQTPDPRTVWENKVTPEERADPAFAFVEEDPALPRVLLIGDSISVGYTPHVRKLLEGKANVLRIPVNGGPTSRGMECLADWLGDGKWDVIHFNWGLHDIKRMRDGKVDISGEWQVSPRQYRKNLNALVRQLKATGARLVWASTTPVPEGANGRVKGDEVTANHIAERVMKKHGIAMNDLYGRVLPDLGKYQKERNVHFNDEGSMFLAKQVAAAIEKALPTK